VSKRVAKSWGLEERSVIVALMLSWAGGRQLSGHTSLLLDHLSYHSINSIFHIRYDPNSLIKWVTV
jgi:hypothetical protein